MNNPLLIKKSAVELAHLLKERKIQCTAILDQLFQQIQTMEPQIQAFLDLPNKDLAYTEAQAIDDLYDKGVSLPFLAGIPIAIKDNICVKGQKTTCASKILENFVAPYDATVIEKLKANKMILFGKTNLDEFAMGASTENSAYQITRNPHDLTCVPGGSSGGSAAAVAAGETIFALGSDTGGSIRQPASFCGVVGCKPTYGRVSRFGLVAFASSLDQIGPLTKTVADSAHLLNAICGVDPHDSTSADFPVEDFTKSLNQDVNGLRIGVPQELFNDNLHPDVKKAIEKSLAIFQKGGAIFEIIKLATFDYAVPTYYIIAPAEASSNLARFDGVRYGVRSEKSANLRALYKKTRGLGFGPEVKRRIILGTFALSSGYYDAYYLKAQKVRTLIKEDFNQAFKKYDIILTPTAPTPAFKIGEMVNDPLSMYLADIATSPVNLAGLPAISVPCGVSKDNLPIGLQLIAKSFGESTMIKAADYFEKAFSLNN
ncbi:MAG: Asp-tRNA(Asn)/Glu-tRNA(Gln) amidotransferase subunit GatA [Candidatus Margulisiibacteriota bacterium]|jgi:aspartyl-tRNA(Asn)/glutamyl-tRNA(Gln) amidotransferase subunit A